MGGWCNKEDVAITCTAKGILKIKDVNGMTLRVTCYYSKDVDGTIVSPTAIVRQHSLKFSSFIQYSNCDDNTGNIKLLGRQGFQDFQMTLLCQNDLWYHEPPSQTTDEKATINKISTAATYELWHQRTGHASSHALQVLHQHAKGVPKLKGNAFYKCPSCMTGKLATKRSLASRKKLKCIPIPPQDQDENPLQGEPGQHYHMDFGFVRAKENSLDITKRNIKNPGKITTSIDGFKCYLIVIDRVTRYTWIFLSTTKDPPVETIRQLLQKFKSDNPNRTVRTDQGGELGHSSAFSKMLVECDYTLEETGPDASAQNGLAERPNRTFGQMMRCMLHSAELGPEFWSYALIHAVYIKNRLYHNSIKITPYEAMTGRKPDLSNLRIFGCRELAKNPGKRPHKLDHHTTSGIFIGMTASNKIARYIDENSGVIKTATHLIYDEACMTLPSHKVPIAARTLQILGYDLEPKVLSQQVQGSSLKVQKLTKDAKLPSQATQDSVGYDIHSNLTQDIIIEPKQIAIIPTGLAMDPPPGTYIKIAPRSGLTIKNQLTTMAGIIDPDYRGEIKIIMRNFGDTPQTISRHSKIAQFLVEKVDTPTIIECEHLSTTDRGNKGFGSSDKKPIHLPNNTINDIVEYRQNAAVAASMSEINKLSIIPAYFEENTHLYLSTDPYDNVTTRTIDYKQSDDDPLLGMVLEQCSTRNLPQLKDCKKGSSTIRIPLWKSQLRNSFITHINGISTYTINQIQSIIKTTRQHSPTEPIDITFATIEKQSMHPQFGVPHLYHDQMNIIAKHLWELNHKPEWSKDIDEDIITPFVLDADKKIKTKYSPVARKRGKLATMQCKITKAPKKLTRKYLKQQDDWDDWNKSEFKQLDQYHAQNTLGLPTKLPKGANLLPLLWTYLIKDCGTKRHDAFATAPLACEAASL